MKSATLGLGVVAAAVLAVPALAHHSFAMFDAEKTVTMTGMGGRHSLDDPVHEVSATSPSQLSADLEELTEMMPDEFSPLGLRQSVFGI